MNTEYTAAERFTIRRMFNSGKRDGEIALALYIQTGRECGAEAIRKQRRMMGLKKVPSYVRWKWVPEGQLYASLGLTSACFVTNEEAQMIADQGRTVRVVA